jgi:hypothetical protein
MRFDHVIITTPDLDRTAQRWMQRGFDVLPGGRHDGTGTANRIIPLGAGYVELLTVVDREEAAATRFGGWALATLGDDERLMGWALSVDAVEPIAERLGTGTDVIARSGLRALTAGLAEAAARPERPFFIARQAGTPDPGSVAAGHRVPVDGLATLVLGGTRTDIEGWCQTQIDLNAIELVFDATQHGLLGGSIRSEGRRLPLLG